MGSPAPAPPPLARSAPRFNINAIVAQAIAALQQSQNQTTPPPSTMPPDFLATLEILGQEPGPRRPLGAAGNAVFDAWAQAAAAAERVTILRGNGQLARAGTTLPVAPAITITDGFGQPTQGVRVQFTVSGGGSIVPGSGSINTDQDGVSSLVEWKLGPMPGLNQLEVKVGGNVVAEFVATAVPTRRCEIYDGDGQSGTSGTQLPIAPAVRVIDATTGQPLPGLNVAFTLHAAGTIGNATDVTDPDGIATAGAWTPGQVGTNTLVATVDGANAATFTAQA
jgi:hypothetical protein